VLREEVTSETLLRDRKTIVHILQKQNNGKKQPKKKGVAVIFRYTFFSENYLAFLMTHAIIFRPSVISLRDLSVYSAVLYQFCAF